MKAIPLGLAVAMALGGTACTGDPPGGCADVAGVWQMTNDAPAGTSCSVGPSTFVWTITQEGCNVAVAESGASGTVAGDTLHVEWTWNLECFRYFEWATAAVAGDAMSGEWHVVRTSSGTCFGGGTCSAPVHGTRQVR